MSDPVQKFNGPLSITVEEFDRMVEAGEDVGDYIDWDKCVMVAPGEISPGQILSMQKAAASRENAPQRLIVTLSQSALGRLRQLALGEGATLEEAARRLIEQQLELRSVPS